MKKLLQLEPCDKVNFHADSLVFLGIYENKEKDPEKLFEAVIPFRFLNLVRGWEMKEVLTIPLPEALRYMVLKKWIKGSKGGHLVVFCFCDR